MKKKCEHKYKQNQVSVTMSSHQTAGEKIPSSHESSLPTRGTTWQGKMATLRHVPALIGRIGLSLALPNQKHSEIGLNLEKKLKNSPSNNEDQELKKTAVC